MDSCDRVDSVYLYSPSSCLTVGDTTHLVAEALHNGFPALINTSEDQPTRFIWKSSAPDVAPVTNGTVRALQLGTVTISATTQGVTGEQEFTTDQPVDSLLITLSSVTPHLGDTVDITVQALDSLGQPMVGPRVASYAANALKMVSLATAETPTPTPYTFRAWAQFAGEASVTVWWSCLSHDMVVRDTTITVGP
jgi:hypothetical protein